MYNPSPEQYRWDVQNTGDVYPAEINLSYEQKEKMYLYSMSKMLVHKGIEYLTDFEEWEHESMVFRTILNDEQFNIYSDHLAAMRKRHEEAISLNDQELVKEISKAESRIKFYREAIVQPILKSKDLILVTAADHKKLEYLRTEYKDWLTKQRHRISVHHFRDYKALSPNRLKLALLKHQLDYIFPDIFFFLSTLDQSASSLVEDLCEGFSKFHHLNEHRLTQVKKDLIDDKQQQQDALFEIPAIWITPKVITPVTISDKDFQLSIALIDQDEYGWISNDYIY